MMRVSRAIARAFEKPRSMDARFQSHLRGTLDAIRADGFEKRERVIASPQAAEIELAGGQRVLNFCANNYLGLANDPRLVAGGPRRARPLRLRALVRALHLRHPKRPHD